MNHANRRADALWRRDYAAGGGNSLWQMPLPDLEIAVEGAICCTAETVWSKPDVRNYQPEKGA